MCELCIVACPTPSHPPIKDSPKAPRHHTASRSPTSHSEQKPDIVNFQIWVGILNFGPFAWLSEELFSCKRRRYYSSIRTRYPSSILKYRRNKIKVFCGGPRQNGRFWRANHGAHTIPGFSSYTAKDIPAWQKCQQRSKIAGVHASHARRASPLRPCDIK